MDLYEIAIESEKMTLVIKNGNRTTFYEDASLDSKYVSTYAVNKKEQQPITQI